eukprot:RCo003740
MQRVRLSPTPLKKAQRVRLEISEEDLTEELPCIPATAADQPRPNSTRPRGLMRRPPTPRLPGLRLRTLLPETPSPLSAAKQLPCAGTATAAVDSVSSKELDEPPLLPRGCYGSPVRAARVLQITASP